MIDQAKATAVKFLEEQTGCATGRPTSYARPVTPPTWRASRPWTSRATRSSRLASTRLPDLKHQIEEVIGEDDRVAVRFRLTGTNSGSFMGNAPSGKRIDAGALALMRVESGKVSELRGEFDQLRLMQQTGALPGW